MDLDSGAWAIIGGSATAACGWLGRAALLWLRGRSGERLTEAKTLQLQREQIFALKDAEIARLNKLADTLVGRLEHSEETSERLRRERDLVRAQSFSEANDWQARLFDTELARKRAEVDRDDALATVARQAVQIAGLERELRECREERRPRITTEILEAEVLEVRSKGKRQLSDGDTETPKPPDTS